MLVFPIVHLLAINRGFFCAIYSRQIVLYCNDDSLHFSLDMHTLMSNDAKFFLKTYDKPLSFLYTLFFAPLTSTITQTLPFHCKPNQKGTVVGLRVFH